MRSRASAADALCACATARHVARLLTQLYDGFLRRADVQAPQFALMVVVDKDPGCSQVGIGRRCAMDKTTVFRNLKLLERKGWVASTVGPDGRQRRVALTAAGRKKLAAGWPEWRKAQDHLRSVMTGREWAAMFRTFQTITRATESARRALEHS